MIEKFHLEGMGLMGCLIADALTLHNRDFTWEDSEEPVAAWPASTGGVFPAGDDESWRNYWRWHTTLSAMGAVHQRFAAHWQACLAGYWESAAFCYLSKHPPHEGSRRGVTGVASMDLPNGLRLTLGSMPSYHFNVQAYVRGARERYAEKRREYGRYEDSRRNPVPGPGIIVTHGFRAATHFIWGWSAKLVTRFNGSEVEKFLAPLRGTLRPCLYLRRGRAGDYLWPVPNGDPYMYNAGSARVWQKQPKQLDLWPKFERWVKFARDLFPDITLEMDRAQVKEGWRPVATGYMPPIGKTAEGAWQVRPMGGSGLRHWWTVYDAMERELNLGGVI